jgi:hypothetical protein
MGSDQRKAPRFALLQTAKLTMTQGEFLCVVRELSETGLSIRLFHPLRMEKRQTIEFQAGASHEIETIWERDGLAGFNFTAPIDLSQGIASSNKHPKRPLRLNIDIAVTVSAGDQKVLARLRNMSTQGARFECGARHLAIEELITIEAAPLPPVRAKIRWREDHTYGVAFIDVFSLASFARYAAALQLSGKAQKRRGRAATG